MKVADLIAIAGERGLSIVLGDDGAPKISGPVMHATEPLRRVLSRRRAEIIRHLGGDPDKAPPPPKAVEPPKIDRPLFLPDEEIEPWMLVFDEDCYVDARLCQEAFNAWEEWNKTHRPKEKS